MATAQTLQDKAENLVVCLESTLDTAEEKTHAADSLHVALRAAKQTVNYLSLIQQVPKEGE